VRRRIGGVLGLLLAACGGVASQDLAPGAAAPPAVAVEHLLLVTIDTLRADAVGFAGNARAATPVLDRLAAGGAAFADTHAHSVMTLPSHANILTGLYPYQHGVRDNEGFRLPVGVATAAELLSAAGFATAAFVGAFPLDARFGLDRGFDLYDDRLSGNAGGQGARALERPGDQVVAAARAWWAAQGGRRRFAWVHLYEPHAPYEPPAALAARAAGDPYLGEVAAADAYLAPLLEPFLAGAEEPTLVVVTGDHGEALGDHGELTHGLFAYEATLRVPLVLWAPGLEPGRRTGPARHVDLLPTLLAAAGVPAPPGLPGRSLLAPGAPPEGSYFEALTASLDRGWAPLRGTIVDGMKFIELPLPELYDLEADPAEAENLVGERTGAAEALAAALPEESAWPPGRGRVGAEEEAALRSLGYLGGRAGGKTAWSPADDPKRLVPLDRKVHELIDAIEKGSLEEAIAVGREVLAARPDLGPASYYLAQALLAADRTEEAVATMAEAVRLGSATPALVRQLGLTLAELGRHGEAIALLERAAVGGDPDDLAALGLALSEAGRQREAQASLERAFAADPRNATVWQDLALVALRQGEWPAARERSERALAENDGLGLAWSYLGSARYNLGDPRGALAAWERAVAIDPTDFDALYNIGLVAPEVGEREKARAALERFLAAAPPERYGADFADVRQRLAALGG
jgi:arylsulfatase A-like enzyme/cytochrome c-type biogenesis protein CcmH/NrfG